LFSSITLLIVNRIFKFNASFNTLELKSELKIKIYQQNRRMKWRHSKEYREDLSKTNANKEQNSSTNKSKETNES
jgi:hypothetical protein